MVLTDLRPMVLTLIAGFLDALGYAQLGHLYVSFMSGNSTHLGMSLQTLDWADAGLAFCIIAMFVAGAWLGTRLLDRQPSRKMQVVLGVEVALIGLAILLCQIGQTTPGLITVAGVMGMQNCLHQTVARADVGKGYLTGNLFSLGQALARLDRQAALANASSWLCFIIGVVLGALVFALAGLVAGLVIIGLAIFALAVRASGWQVGPAG